MSAMPWHTSPRLELGHFPTPLELLPRLSEELGGPRIWLKRDDCSGLAHGGNKTRKLEFLTGAAREAGADTLLTFGAVQSNHCRQTAAAAARLGFDCHLVLARMVQRDHKDYETGGNVLLDELLGAALHFTELAEAEALAARLVADLEAAGKTPYVIPGGGSNATGAQGYAVCAEELVQQCAAQDVALETVIHASSSAGTQAGLLWGFAHLRAAPRVLGVNVSQPDPATVKARIQKILSDLDEQAPAPAPVDIEVNHAYFGTAYGQPTAECIEAIRMVARLEGLLFDPVYSGKAVAALIDQINLGNFSDARDVILIHTGGTPVLSVYDDAFV